MTHDEAVKTIKEALYDGHPCMIENLFLDALAALDSLAVEPSEDAVISGTFRNVSSHDHAMNEEEIKNFYRDTDGETVEPSEDAKNLDWLEARLSIYRNWTTQFQILLEEKRASLAREINERIRRECADKAIAWAEYYSGDDWQPVTKDSFREAIMGEAKKEGK